MFDFFFGICRSIWYTFGLFIVIAIAFNLMSGGRLDVKTVLNPILHAITHMVKLILTCCAAIGKAAAKHVSPPLKPLVQHGLPALIILMLFAWLIISMH